MGIFIYFSGFYCLEPIIQMSLCLPFFHGDLNLWHCLTEYLPVMAMVNTIIQHWLKMVIKWLTCKLSWWIVVWGAARWITLISLCLPTATMAVNQAQHCQRCCMCLLLVRHYIKVVWHIAFYIWILTKTKQTKKAANAASLHISCSFPYKSWLPLPCWLLWPSNELITITWCSRCKSLPD